MYYSLLHCQSRTSDSSGHQQHENTREGNSEVEWAPLPLDASTVIFEHYVLYYGPWIVYTLTAHECIYSIMATVGLPGELYAHATNEWVCVVHHRPTAQECLLCNNQHPRNHPPCLIISATTFHDNWKHSACTLKKCLKAIDWYLLDHSASAALSDSCSNSCVMPTNTARFGCNLFTAAKLCPFSETHPRLSKPTISKPAKLASSHTKFPKQKFAKSNWQRKENRILNKKQGYSKMYKPYLEN